MRHEARNGDRKQPNDHDDLWAWAVIGLIFLSVTLALYLPLIWSSLQAA